MLYRRRSRPAKGMKARVRRPQREIRNHMLRILLLDSSSLRLAMQVWYDPTQRFPSADGCHSMTFNDLPLQELAGNNETIFVGGLASFLVAHLFYSRAFMIPNWSVNFRFLAGVGTYMLIVLYHIIPTVEQNLVGPVAVYGCVIGIMLHNSMVRTASSATYFFSLAGATVFTISDTILSFDKFAMPGKIPNAHLIVMVTYYIAQILITLSVSGPVIIATKKRK
eukprot:gb/GECG01015560.1/.p1 GENE.gb/GECG01015560.1/~~gb/GECG01015560.1/.p1  ORF type:complete len:223 (+),score=9.14 gb/GECG01015560.1/:1-669(+)